MLYVEGLGAIPIDYSVADQFQIACAGCQNLITFCVGSGSSMLAMRSLSSVPFICMLNKTFSIACPWAMGCHRSICRPPPAARYAFVIPWSDVMVLWVHDPATPQHECLHQKKNNICRLTSVNAVLEYVCQRLGLKFAGLERGLASSGHAFGLIASLSYISGSWIISAGAWILTQVSTCVAFTSCEPVSWSLN